MPKQAETTEERERRIAEIQEKVVGMYSEHPWPGDRRTDEEMGWRLKVLGIKPGDYVDKEVLDVGCGTAEYALWYASNGAGKVTGIDLSDGSLAIARDRAEQAKLENVEFLKQNVLSPDLPDDHFDYSYSVGVLHHTGAPFQGFKEMVRVTKPGGVVIVSLYNVYSRSWLRCKQRVCRWLGGDDIEARARWGRRLFPFTMRKLNKRYHGLNYEEISYDIFGFPHESIHTGNEVLGWFDQAGVEYAGSFAPLRLRDYSYAFSQPEYRQFRETFDGFPGMRLVSDAMAKVSPFVVGNQQPPFPRPSKLSTVLCQLGWVPFSLRFNCFTVAGRKKVQAPS